MSRNALICKASISRLEFSLHEKTISPKCLTLRTASLSRLPRPPRSWKPIAASLDEKIRALEGNRLELLPCPVPLCARKFKYNKNFKKRAAEPVIMPSKLTAIINKNNNLDIELKIPRKTVKNSNDPQENTKITATNNKFAALNIAKDDVEDVTPAAPKIKPVMMKLFPEYII
ncbi:hypothetical protein TNCV_1962331 [Trichonephila clavipes]|nr:hypothetical protein TNCV_1962331 [Trichonephila clavipes]